MLVAVDIDGVKPINSRQIIKWYWLDLINLGRQLRVMYLDFRIKLQNVLLSMLNFLGKYNYYYLGNIWKLI